MTLNEQELSASEFEALTQVEIGDKWQVSVSEGYNYSLDYEYLNESGNKVWSYGTNEGLNGNLTVSPSHLTYVIKITQNAKVVYTKTITVNHDIFENVMVGEVAMTFDEFVANPEVEYGKNLKFNLKTGYESIFTFSANDFEVTENTTITIKYQLSGERVYKTIEVTCRTNALTNIEIDGESVTYEDFLQMNSIHLGSSLTFTINEEFVNVIEVVINNNGQDNVLTGQQTYTFNEVGSWQLNIREKDTQNYIDDIYLYVVLFDSIEINDKTFGTSSSTYVEYGRDLGENTFEISFDGNLLNKYDLYYEMNSSKIKLTQSTFEVLINENEEYAYAHIYAYINDEYLQVLSISFTSFCPVETVSIDIYRQDNEENPQYNIYNNEVDLTSYGAISSLDITFKENYTGCTYKIFDESGAEIQDFTTIKNATYTIKIYSNNRKKDRQIQKNSN